MADIKDVEDTDLDRVASEPSSRSSKFCVESLRVLVDLTDSASVCMEFGPRLDRGETGDPTTGLQK